MLTQFNQYYIFRIIKLKKMSVCHFCRIGIFVVLYENTIINNLKPINHDKRKY